MAKDLSRRKFVQDAGLTTMALGLNPMFIKAQSSAKKDKVKIGIIGTGYRGQSHIEMLCQRTDTVIVAFADPDKQMLADAQKILKDGGRPAAVEYNNGNENFKQLLQRTDIDAVIIATP
jgi:predicted dehydrogenase